MAMKYQLVPVDHDPFGEVMEPVLPVPKMPSWADVKNAVRGLLPSDPFVGAGKAVEEYRKGNPLGAMEEFSAVTPGQGIFGGKLSKTADINVMREAQLAASEGRHPAEIWKQHGWFQGVDGKWRYEISDKDAWINGKLGANIRMGATPKGLQVKDVLDHPKLYEAYPDLANIKFEVLPQDLEARGIAGQFDPGQEKLSLGVRSLSSPEVMLHELQHGVQAVEGFAPGGNQRMAEFARAELDPDDIGLSLRRAVEYKDNKKSMDAILQKQPQTLQMIRKFAQIPTEKLKGFVEEHEELLPSDPWKVYKNFAGEVEARNVETRYRMGNKLSPWRTEDALTDSQILVNKRNSSPLFSDYQLKDSQGLEKLHERIHSAAEFHGGKDDLHRLLDEIEDGL